LPTTRWTLSRPDLMIFAREVSSRQRSTGRLCLDNETILQIGQLQTSRASRRRGRRLMSTHNAWYDVFIHRSAIPTKCEVHDQTLTPCRSSPRRVYQNHVRSQSQTGTVRRHIFGARQGYGCRRVVTSYQPTLLDNRNSSFRSRVQIANFCWNRMASSIVAVS
jgi:hypothetical protein